MSSSSLPSCVRLVLLMSMIMMILLNSSSTCQACNICGCEDGCYMTNLRTIVTFFHNNHTKQLSCGQLQDKANSIGFKDDFCQPDIVNKAWEKCGCYNKYGQPLSGDYYDATQTIPPVAAPAAPAIGTYIRFRFVLTYISLLSPTYGRTLRLFCVCFVAMEETAALVIVDTKNPLVMGLWHQ
jgi:hypothetical protein